MCHTEGKPQEVASACQEQASFDPLEAGRPDGALQLSQAATLASQSRRSFANLGVYGMLLK